jgi:small subunit ribosomal protein S3
MGVQITISGKLRGDRSSFEKHSAGILPRAGHHARVVVDEDISHVPTPMGYIGVRIRIARKERYIPEFELKGAKEEKAEAERLRLEREEEERRARTESEQIKIDAEKIEKMDLMEEVEEKLK